MSIYDPQLGGDPIFVGAWETTVRSIILAAGPLVVGVLAIRHARGRRSPDGERRPRD